MKVKIEEIEFCKSRGDKTTDTVVVLKYIGLCINNKMNTKEAYVFTSFSTANITTIFNIDIT